MPWQAGVDRLRDVAQGADGFIYVITSDIDAYGPGRKGGDRIIRLAPDPSCSPLASSLAQGGVQERSPIPERAFLSEHWSQQVVAP